MNPYETLPASSAPPWWVQLGVLAVTFAYLPSYWSYRELAPGGDARRVL